MIPINKKKLVRRLKIIEGQVRGLQPGAVREYAGLAPGDGAGHEAARPGQEQEQGASRLDKEKSIKI